MSFNFQLSIILTCGTDESLQDIINHLQISSHFWSSWDDQSYARTHYIWETDWKHAWARSLLLPLHTLLKLLNNSRIITSALAHIASHQQISGRKNMWEVIIEFVWKKADPYF